MRILQLLCFPFYGSGSGIYTRKLSKTLTNLGHEVAIACPDNRKIPGVKIFEIKLPFMAAFTGHPEYPEAKLYSQLTGAQINDIQSAFMKEIIQAVEKFQPDVIHVHHASNLSWIANYIKAVYQIHFVITSHNTDIINAVLDKRYIPLTQDALRRTDFIFAVSKDTKERLLGVLGKGITNLARKTKVIPCGIDTENFPVEGTMAIVNRKYNLSNKKIALYSGKITPIKGVDIFIQAAASFPEAIFVVMGDGDEITKMKDFAKSKKISNVVFTGYLGAKEGNLVQQLYRRADVLAVPSTLSEGIPLSILEAMSSGTTVVASNIGGNPTVIKNMKNGLLVRPRSVAALVEGIRLIFSNEKLARKLSETARKNALTKFDWQVIAKKMEKYYKITFERSQKNRQTKRPSFITEEEYKQEKLFVKEVQKIKKGA